ncbi:MAG: helix-turn-helix transcriptional regulator [Proteobacteria bacterium]|nr:helix-turn-helix transcriptional regulator [Pseudomonadota bacterium]MBI3498550.1 helix-turn-helix transcriptional regulator [Pseudomonadota bacterium]
MGRARGAIRDQEAVADAKKKEPRRVLSPAQCRAARAILGWTQADLAERSELARKTIADFEMNVRSLQFRTRRDITAAFEGVGIEFIWGSEPDEHKVDTHHGKANELIEGLRFSHKIAAKK